MEAACTSLVWRRLAATCSTQAPQSIPPVASPRRRGSSPPYHQSPSAQVRSQTQYIFEHVKEGLADLGSSIGDVCQVEQYIQHKSQADGYLETSRGPEFMDKNRPGSALMATGDFVPFGAVVTPTGIAVIPEAGIREKEIHSSGLPTPGLHPEMGDSYKAEAPYSEIVTAGPYVFNTVWASDYATGVHPEVKVAQWVWWGNEARNEVRFNLRERLKPRLDHVGSELANVVHATVYLTEIDEDLYEVDRVWIEVFPPTRPPGPWSRFGGWEARGGREPGTTPTEEPRPRQSSSRCDLATEQNGWWSKRVPANSPTNPPG